MSLNILALPFLKELATSVAQQFVSKELPHLDKYQTVTILQAITEAYEEWILSIFGSLQMQGYEDAEIRRFFADYRKLLEIFLELPEITEELLKPFKTEHDKIEINAARLAQCWQTLHLPGVENLEIDFTVISRAYLRRLQKSRIVKWECREIFRVQFAQERATYLETIRNQWRDFNLNLYTERVMAQYQTLDLSTLTAPARDDEEETPLLLKEVFIPQMAQASFPLNADEERPILPVLKALANPKQRLFALLGAPGAGKSVLARYLLLSILGQDEQSLERVKTFAGYLPLLVELRDYLAAKTQSYGAYFNFIEYFQYLSVTHGFGINHLALAEQLKTRPALVIFDGLDEIFNPRERAEVIEEIIGFTTLYPQVRIIVTSRLTGYTGHALRAANFQEYTLLDFTPEQTDIFIKTWFGILFADRPEESEMRRRRLDTALENSPSLRHLAGNPLLLTILANIAKHQELCRDRTKLYEYAVKIFCHHWEVTGDKLPISALPENFMNAADKIELLSRIAWNMQTGAKGLAGNFILGENLQIEIERYLQERWQLQGVEKERVSLAMIDQLREHSFILCPCGPSVYGFTHRAFLEYFCAAEIVYRFNMQQNLSFERLKNKIFLSHLQNESWHEILRLVCSLVAPRFAGLLINAIMPSRQIAFEKSEELILAIQCLGEIGNLREATDAAKNGLKSILGWFEKDRKIVKNALEKEGLFLEKAVPIIEMIGKRWPHRAICNDWATEHSLLVESSSAFKRIINALSEFKTQKTEDGMMRFI